MPNILDSMVDMHFRIYDFIKGENIDLKNERVSICIIQNDILEIFI